jgi:short-subunit dehydrogenase
VVRTAFFDRCLVGQTRLFKLAPRSDAPATAEAGWRGFKAGKRLVIPRWINRVITTICVIVPESVLLRIIARFQRLR